MTAVPFGWMYQDPVLIIDRLRDMRARMADEERRLKAQDRRRKAKRIRVLTNAAKAGKLKGDGYER
jgi:hypothetical protein